MTTGRSLLDIALRLRATLVALEMSQAELSRRTGYTQPRINNWLAGTARPDIEAAHTLCDKLGITMDWIYRGNQAQLPGDLQAKLAAASRPIPVVAAVPARRRRQRAS